MQLRPRHEAPYVGFSQQRDPKDQSWDSAEAARSSMPRRAGKSLKTDRIDATDLAAEDAGGPEDDEQHAEQEQDDDDGDGFQHGYILAWLTSV